MDTTADEVFAKDVGNLPLSEQLRLAALILRDLTQAGIAVVEQSDAWSEQDRRDLTAFSLQHFSQLYPEDQDIA